MSELEFKLSAHTELQSIVTLARKTVNHSHRSFIDDDALDAYLRSNHLLDYLKSNIDNTWVLYKKDTIIGFAVCVENVIDFMLIDVDYQNQGYGSLLLKYCEAQLFKKHNVIALESYKKNLNANKFYLANNWLFTEQYRDPKHNAEKIIYRKRADLVQQQRMVAAGG